jgi:hypothetical protein
MDPGMTKAKGRQRREKGVKEISGAPEAKESPEEPDEEGDEEGIRSDYPIYLSDEDRAFVRMVHGSRNQLLDFAIVQQVNVDGEWHDVVRYDCNHGTVHVHLFRRGGKPGLRRSLVMSGSSEGDPEGGQGPGGVASVATEGGGEVGRSGMAEHADREVAQARHDLRGGPRPHLGGVLGEGHIPHVVQAVLDRPVPPD